MNEKEEVSVRVQQFREGWDWYDIVELNGTFDEFLDRICRAAHQHGKDGLPYDGRLGKVMVSVFDDDDVWCKEEEGIVDEFDPWNYCY
jgi:hypothetical protein